MPTRSNPGNKIYGSKVCDSQPPACNRRLPARSRARQESLISWLSGENGVARYVAARKKFGKSCVNTALRRQVIGKAWNCIFLPAANPFQHRQRLALLAAKSFGGKITGLEALDHYKISHLAPTTSIEIAIPRNRGINFGANRPKAKDGVVSFRETHYTANTVGPYACPLDALTRAFLQVTDPLDRVCMLESALNQSLITPREFITRAKEMRRPDWLAALNQVDVSRSIFETMTRVEMRKANLHVQPLAVIPQVGEVDFLVNDWLIVELDGWKYHSDKEQIRRDHERMLSAARLGYLTQRFHWHGRHTGEIVTEKVTQILREAPQKLVQNLSKYSFAQVPFPSLC